MAKLGETVPHVIEITVDFLASTQAFKEYMGLLISSDIIPDDVPSDKFDFYLERLRYYRSIYHPQGVKDSE
ncbi:hypothetical protein GR294_21435 [Raoultella sp. Lac2]|jgi:hypothetical protein|uniref:Uncharacterized protein n=1 Tax=Klebsiella electrica TaxID=1259973 RepID=A0AAJ5QY59_9ENTR|nr:hypothetical protein [Klebsiella electrica]MXF49062.1 hypothetical protein [Raoultella sp. Lac2]MXF99083.1 hypothetical protein [Raoultella sp. Lac1]QDI08178.1 hypothetical protein electrica_02019 [Klebsiella electrica]WBW63208.1 hypothetical protein OR613_10055 [Klebsiella electrica]